MRNLGYLVIGAALWAVAGCDDAGADAQGGHDAEVTVDAVVDALADAGDPVDATADLGPVLDSQTADGALDATADSGTLDGAVPVDSGPPDAFVPRCPGDDRFEEDDEPQLAVDTVPGESTTQLICAGDEDWRLLQVCGGSEITLDLSFSHAEGDLDLQLRDGAGEVLERSVSTDDNESLTFVAGPEDQRLYARIYGYEAAEAEYRFAAAFEACEVEGCDADEAEPNGDWQSASPTLPGLYQRTICAGDEDWLRVDLCAGASVAVETRFSHDAGDLDLHLYSHRGIRLQRSTSSTDNEAVLYRAQEAASVFVRVFGYRGAENSYGLVVRVEGECGGCGDGAVSGLEACDGAAETSCTAEGFDFGEARCSDTCAHDLSACRYDHCGDGRVTGRERCEPGQQMDCEALGLGAGIATCGAGCLPDVSACRGGRGATGVVRFQRREPVCNPVVGSTVCADDDCCLDPRPEAVRLMPVRGALVQAIDPDSKAVLAEAYTDASGRYTVQWPAARPAQIAVFSASRSPRVMVVDNTDAQALYGLELGTVSPGPGHLERLDAVMRDGFTVDGFSKDSTRQAAPFAVLDTLTEVKGRVEAARPNLRLEPLITNWSVHNETCSGNKSIGCIGTSHFDGRQLFILGKHGVDTDELDHHVLAHEFSHYLDRQIGRSDSPGGSHSGNQVKDISLAMSEGHANAMSAILLHPDTVYIDTRGATENTGFYRNMQNNAADRLTGFFNERTVERLIYDLFDSPSDAEPWDGVTLSLGQILDVVAAQRRSEAFSSLFSFITHAKVLWPAHAAAIDQFIAERYGRPSRCNAAYPKGCGISPITNVWGDGEIHDGGWHENLPRAPVERFLHVPLEVDGPAHALVMRHGTDAGEGPGNWLSEVRYFRFEGTGGPVAVHLDCPDDLDVDMWLYQRGVAVGDKWQTFGEGGFGDERIEVETAAGLSYAVRVRGDDWDAVDPYTCQINVERR